MSNKVANDLVNKAVFGAIFMGMVAVFATIMKMVGITVSGNLTDVGVAWTHANIGTFLAWIVSIGIFAGVAIFMTKHRHSIMVLGRSQHTPSPPNVEIKWYGFIGVGLLISVALWALQYLAFSMGGTIGLSQLWTSISSGSGLGVLGAVLSYIAVGYIVEAIASHLMGIQKTVENSSIGNKLT